MFYRLAVVNDIFGVKQVIFDPLPDAHPCGCKLIESFLGKKHGGVLLDPVRQAMFPYRRNKLGQIFGVKKIIKRMIDGFDNTGHNGLDAALGGHTEPVRAPDPRFIFMAGVFRIYGRLHKGDQKEKSRLERQK